MLSLFRRLVHSKVGVIVTLSVLVVIALAFAAGDVTSLRTRGIGALGGDTVAKVGGDSVATTNLRNRSAAEFEAARQQQQTLTMADFLAAGGVDGTLDRLVGALAFRRFGHQLGMVVSRRAVDGQLAAIPGLQLPNGDFDVGTYQRLLAQRRLTDADVRGEIADQIVQNQLIAPIIGAQQVPRGVALPYASLLLERRLGQIAFIPAAAMARGTPPSDAELTAFYTRNVARYTVPQRRIVRYALVTPDTVKAQATPTDAEIAAAYQADKASYAPSEKRTVESVTATDAATAGALAAKVRAGTPLAAAAKAAGLEAVSNAALTKAAYAAANSAAVADAVFGAAKDALVGPVKAPLGYVVARVTAIAQDPGKTLDQARPEIAAKIAKRKAQEALASLRDAVDGTLAKNATFDEAVADAKLAAQTTPPVLGTGVDPEHPDVKPDPALTPVLTAAFSAEDGDPPQLVATGSDGSFALVALGRIVPAAARPLATVREAVTKDFDADRARTAARRAAIAVVAAAGKGRPLAQALSAAGPGVTIAAPKPLDAVRGQVAAQQAGQIPAPLALLFSMAPGTAKLLEGPSGIGYYVVQLERIEPHDAASQPALVGTTAADLGRLVGREYAGQFARAVRAASGATINADALARVKKDLAGGSGSDSQ